MGDTGIEYKLTFSLLFFLVLSSLCFSFLGLQQMSNYDFSEENTNLYTGFKFFFSNPFTDTWTKFIYSLIIIIPFGAVVSMITLNYIRGR